MQQTGPGRCYPVTSFLPFKHWLLTLLKFEVFLLFVRDWSRVAAVKPAQAILSQFCLDHDLHISSVWIYDCTPNQWCIYILKTNWNVWFWPVCYTDAGVTCNLLKAAVGLNANKIQPSGKLFHWRGKDTLLCFWGNFHFELGELWPVKALYCWANRK